MSPITPDGPASARWLDTSALTDPTRCPACAAPLAGRRCAVCRFDPSGPRGRQLWDLSHEATRVLDRRSELIAQMRLESAAAQPAPARPVPVQPAAVLAPRVPLGVPVRQTPVPTRPGWGLQTILQVLGAVLLCGAGLVFTVFAWGHLSMAVRGLILAAITAAVFAGAHRAARAGLKTAAEVVAGLGSFLVVLDAWVLWTAAVSGLGAVADDGTAWSVSLVLGAVVLVPLGRALSLVTVSLTGLVCLTAAPAVLALTISSAPGSASLLALSAALCLYAPRLFGPRVVVAGVSVRARARVVLASLAPYYVGASAVAVLVALLGVGATQSVGPLLALAAVCGVWAAAAGPGARRWSAAAGYALVLASTVGAAALTPTTTSAAVWMLPLGAVVGCGATVGVLRALPRIGAPAARAAWMGVLLAGVLPVFVVVVLALDVLSEPVVLTEAGNQEAVLHTLAGLGVIVAARPLLHLLGAQPLIMRVQVAMPEPAGPVSLPTQHTSHPHQALPTQSAPPQPLPHQPVPQQFLPQPALAQGPVQQGPVQQGTTVPRRPSVLVDHPLGASVIAATLLLLGLALLMPGAAWAVATLLAVAVLVALARTSLVGWIGSASTALVPVRAFRDRITSLGHACVGLVCAVAVTGAALLSFALATGADSTVTRTTGETLVAATFVVAGLVLWVARGWIPVGAIDQVPTRAALALAALVITSVGGGILVRLVVPLDGIGWYAAPFPLVLGLVVVGARDLRRARAIQAGVAGSPSSQPQGAAPGPARRISADHLAALGAATVLCGPGVVVTARAALSGTGQHLAVALLATGLLLLTVALTWQLGFPPATAARRELRAAAGALLPVTSVVALLSLHTVAVAADLTFARIDWSLAVLGLLVVIITWAGARTSGVARLGCEAAVVVLAAVTLTVVAAQDDQPRLSLALALTAVGALAYAVAAGRPRWGWLALGLGAASSWVSLAGSGVPLEAYTAPGGVVVVATGVWQLVTSLRADGAADRSRHAVRLVLGGLIVLVLPSVLLTPGAGAGGRALVVAIGTVWLGGTAWLLTRTTAAVARRLRPLGTGMTVLALVSAVVGLGGYAVAQAAQVVTSGGSRSGTGSSTATGLSTSLWTAVAVLVTAALAVQLAHGAFPRSAPAEPDRTVPLGDPRVWAVTVCTALLTVPVAVLLSGGWFDSASTWVAAALVTVWGIAALLGTPPGLPRVRTLQEFALRAVPALVGAYVTAAIGAAAAAPSSVGVGAGVGAGGGDGALVELMTLAGVVVAIVTVRAAQLTPTSSTWTTAVFGAVATILPLTLDMIAQPSGGRILAATVTAAAWLVLGVRLRWQAPVACGSVALLAQVLVLAGPPALAAMSGMLGWIVLAVVGGALLALGLTYERQITAARTVLRHYSELR